MDKTFEFKKEKVKEVALNVLRMRLQRRLGKYSFKSVSIDILASQLAEDAAFEISVKILGQPNVQEYRVPYQFPKNWWQHLRMTILPTWWLEKHPVKMETVYETVSFNHMALLPKWDMFPKGQEIVMCSQVLSPGVERTNK